MNRIERVSEYLQLNPDKLAKLGIYDGYVNIDSEVYIHPKLLVDTQIEEFKNSEKKILDYFRKTIELLKNVREKSDSDTYWKICKKHFSFPEPKGVAFGNSINSIDGNGLNGKTAELALEKLKDIIDLGVTDPYVFQLLALVQENIGVDRISDMLISIIYEDLLQYTNNMLNELGITDLEDYTFNKKNYKVKRRPNQKLLILVPEDIVSNIPSCASWYDVQDVIEENNEVKKHIFEMFGEANINVSDMKKEDIFRIILENNMANEILKKAKETEVEPYDFKLDSNGIHVPVEKMKEIFFQNPDIFISTVSSGKSLFEIIGELIKQFQFIVECKGLNVELYKEITTRKGIKKTVPRTESTSHRLFIAILESLSQVHEVDYTYEPKSGNGEVDFRFTKGKEIVLVEFKLNYHSRLVHGYNTQLTEYMKREKCKEAYFVIVKVDDNKNIDEFDKLIPTRDAFKKVVVIDGILKAPPSQL